MIRHIVMWRVSGDTTAENIAARDRVVRAFESLRGRIPGMVHLEVGVDISATDYASDLILVSDFISQAALTSYADHPEHQRVRRELGNLRVSRNQVDYEIHKSP